MSPFSAASLALALQGLKSNAVGDCPFTFTTDKTVASPYEQTVPASIRQRLGGEEGQSLTCTAASTSGTISRSSCGGTEEQTVA